MCRYALPEVDNFYNRTTGHMNCSPTGGANQLESLIGKCGMPCQEPACVEIKGILAAKGQLACASKVKKHKPLTVTVAEA